ncbi:hypothetical protein [Clostridium sp. DL1XJH146]
MKKIMVLGLTAFMTVGLLVGCGQSNNNADNNTANNANNNTNAEENTADEAKYEDGIYFAQEDTFNAENGWKSMVTIEVKDGEITSVDWNAASKNAGDDKKTASENGGYPMVSAGGAQAEWYEQAALVEANLIETQDPTAVEYTDEEGHTDAIAGVSVHVNDFYAVAEEALANGPVGSGMYTDGAYHAEEAEFSHGWKGTVDLTVVNGYIVAANWSAISEEGGDDKKTASMNGEYGMFEGGEAQSAWYEQAQLAEAYLLETQEITDVEYTDEEGHTDVIAGVSVHVSDFYQLVQEALKDAAK